MNAGCHAVLVCTSEFESLKEELTVPELAQKSA